MSSEKWMVLKELVKVLKPLEVATVSLSKEQNSSLSTIYPVVHGLVVKLNATEEVGAGSGAACSWLPSRETWLVWGQYGGNRGKKLG